jgi:hypothetical protein
LVCTADVVVPACAVVIVVLSKLVADAGLTSSANRAANNIRFIFSFSIFPEIDHYGERLIGCIECNRWGRPGDGTLPMQSEPPQIAKLLLPFP